MIDCLCWLLVVWCCFLVILIVCCRGCFRLVFVSVFVLGWVLLWILVWICGIVWYFFWWFCVGVVCWLVWNDSWDLFCCRFGVWLCLVCCDVYRWSRGCLVDVGFLVVVVVVVFLCLDCFVVVEFWFLVLLLCGLGVLVCYCWWFWCLLVISCRVVCFVLNGRFGLVLGVGSYVLYYLGWVWCDWLFWICCVGENVCCDWYVLVLIYRSCWWFLYWWCWFVVVLNLLG